MTSANEDMGEGEEVVTHPQVKLSQLLVHSYNEILSSFDRLEEKFHSMPKGQFEVLQKPCGLTYAKCCRLLDKQLRWSHILQPAKQYCHDWTHCLVSAGIIQVAIYMICSIFLLALVGPWFMITWNCGYAHSTRHNN